MSQGEVTALLARWQQGDPEAQERLTRLIYPEIKAMARRRARGSDRIGASTLVSETFVKLLASGGTQPADRQQFFALMATIMRQVIIDEARAVARLKRSGSNVTLHEDKVADDSFERAQFLVDVDRILEQLDASDERLCRVFECRFFAGLTTDETSAALGIPARTVERLWSEARERVRESLAD